MRLCIRCHISYSRVRAPFFAGLLVLGCARTPGPPAALPAEFRADIVVAIDTSGSTMQPSEIDIDGDGKVGVNLTLEPAAHPPFENKERNTDPGDSILAAELQGVRALLAALEGRDVRVAVVSFAGAVDPVTDEQSGSPAENARVVAPLGDLAAATAGVEAVALTEPAGGTDFSAALRASAAAICSPSARSDVPRIVLLVTDGIPSLPHGRGDTSDTEDVRAATDAARGIAACGGRADVFAVGPQAFFDLTASRAVARSSGGSYHPIRNATDLGVALQLALATPR
jgi:hypothetical protein